MKSVAFAAILCAAAGAAWGQQGPPVKPPAWKAYNRGVTWEKSLKDARARAEKEGKPVLVHQLVGDLDKEGC